MKTTDIQLGDLAEDTITGFRGIVVGHFSYLNGCLRLEVQPQKLTSEGKVQDSKVFDVEQLKLVNSKVAPQSQRSGGPMPAPVRR